jgi:hypothetical protein
MRHLASTSVIKEIDKDMFGPTHFSQALAEPKYEGGVVYWYFSFFTLLLCISMKNRCDRLPVLIAYNLLS